MPKSFKNISDIKYLFILLVSCITLTNSAALAESKIQGKDLAAQQRSASMATNTAFSQEQLFEALTRWIEKTYAPAFVQTKVVQDASGSKQLLVSSPYINEIQKGTTDTAALLRNCRVSSDDKKDYHNPWNPCRAGASPRIRNMRCDMVSDMHQIFYKILTWTEPGWSQAGGLEVAPYVGVDGRMVVYTEQASKARAESTCSQLADLMQHNLKFKYTKETMYTKQELLSALRSWIGESYLVSNTKIVPNSTSGGKDKKLVVTLVNNPSPAMVKDAKADTIKFADALRHCRVTSNPNDYLPPVPGEIRPADQLGLMMGSFGGLDDFFFAPLQLDVKSFTSCCGQLVIYVPNVGDRKRLDYTLKQTVHLIEDNLEVK